MLTSEVETLRWPTNLDHDAIVSRLVRFREAAASCGLQNLSAHFADVEHMAAAKIALQVVGTLTWLLERSEYRPLAKRLEMVAMNLKNLRNDLREVH
jgi:hypothetical protein